MPQLPVDADGRTRAIPRALWTGDTGEFLSSLGMSPDDPSNVIPTADDQEAKLVAARQRHEAMLAQRNAEIGAAHPGCSMTSFYIFSDDVWNGRHASFLVDSLELTPWDDWNVRMLPSDQRTADILNTPVRHPRSQIPQLVEAIERILDEAAQEYRAAWEEAFRTRRFAAFAEKKAETQAMMERIADHMFAQTLEALAAR